MNQTLKPFDRKSMTRIFWKSLSNLTMVCLASLLAVMILQIFFRDVLRMSVPWTDELSRILFIWTIFLASALVQGAGDHVKVTIFVDRLSPSKKRIVNIITEIWSLLILVILIIGSYKMVIASSGILGSTVPISYSYVYLPVTLGIGIMAVLNVRTLIRLLLNKNM